MKRLPLKNKNLFGLVLAGGKSSRMGKDKSILKYHKKSQIEYAFALLDKYCERTFVSNTKSQSTLKEHQKLPQIHDIYKDIGPLGGILTAFKKYPVKAWLILACDLPFVDNKTISTLVQKRDRTKPVTCYRSTYNNLPEPLCAIFEKKARKKLESSLKKNITCPRKILMGLPVKLLKLNKKNELDNINTKEEYKNAISNNK